MNHNYCWIQNASVIYLHDPTCTNSPLMPIAAQKCYSAYWIVRLRVSAPYFLEYEATHPGDKGQWAHEADNLITICLLLHKIYKRMYILWNLTKNTSVPKYYSSNFFEFSFLAINTKTISNTKKLTKLHTYYCSACACSSLLYHDNNHQQIILFSLLMVLLSFLV